MSAPLDVTNILGPFVIECVLASILFGITLTQTAVYYQHCWGQDHYVLIWGIGFLWVLGFMHQFTLTWTVFTFTVTDFGQFSSLAFIPWSFPIGAAFTGVFTIFGQVYFARQIWILGDRARLVPGLILLFAFISFAFAVASCSKGYSYDQFSQLAEFEYGVLVWLCTAAAADVLITGGIVYHLRRHRAETSFRDTRSVLGYIIANTIENNALTCIVASVDAILFAKADVIGAWHVILNGQLVGLYFISLLTSLNVRHRYAAERETVRRMSFADTEAGVSVLSGDTRRDSRGRLGSSGGVSLMKMITRGSVVADMPSAPRRSSSGGLRMPTAPDADRAWSDGSFSLRHRGSVVQIPAAALQRQGVDPIHEDLSYDARKKSTSSAASSTRQA